MRLLIFLILASVACQAQYDTLRFINGESIILKGDTLISFPKDLRHEEYKVVESGAYYPEGMEGLYRYIAQNLRLPIAAKTAGVSGSVKVVFTIDKYGLAKNIQVQGDTTLGRGVEAARIIREMPRWIPATQRGLAKPMRLALPITFNFDVPSKKD
jgi:hypothetical protein